MTAIPKRDALHGSPLHPNAAIQQEYAKAIMTLVRRMNDDTRRELQRVFNESQFAAAAMDDDRSDMTSGTVASQARIALAALLAKYTTLFNRLARRATRRMIDRTLKNSAVTLGLSLRKLAPEVEFKLPGATDRLQEIITASTAEAASLIKLIPQKYLGDVQGAVMRSIMRSVHLYGNVQGIVRTDSQGGDVLQFPEAPGGPPRNWRVTLVMETWPTWCRVIVTLQNPQP